MELSDMLIPLHYDYMIKAIWVCALIGGVCGLLSAFVTLKGWSMMGDALSHAVVPGVATAYILGLPLVLGSFVSGMLAAWAMSVIKKRSKLREDAVLGIVFTAFFALGLLLISLYPARVDLKSIVFGNVLAISDDDVRQLLWISGAVLLVIAIKWRDLLLFCFDAQQARAMGLRVEWMHALLLVLLSATAVAALITVGALLVVAMLITPGATAYLLTDRFSRMLGISATIGVTTAAVGAYASYYANGSTGGCIVSLQTIVFLVCLVVAPKHGLLARRRREREEVAS
jgi:ABC-type Mn2+/Zn2+ transport system permease subunit